ncbi:hypothetical protein H6G04_32435 [Calothrix membranacea FACHB-236]|nr:hypothetical protein [Calothrix membranacea FACHB-236]
MAIPATITANPPIASTATHRRLKLHFLSVSHLYSNGEILIASETDNAESQT